MPTLLTWNYDGDHLAAGNKEEPQRVYPGDIGLDDVFGEVVILSMTGGRLLVEYSDGDKKVTNERTVGHIRAKENRVQQRAAPAVGRPRQAKGDLLNFFGAAGREASPLAEPKKKLAPNAKGLGRTVQQPATGKTPAANKQAAKKPATANKLTGKRKAGADAGGQEELLQEQEANPLAMLLGDAYAASSSEEEEETPAQMRAQPGTLSLRAMSTEHMAAYKHSKYAQTQKDKQEKWRAEFSLWLKVDPVHGFHCALCFGASLKAADKFCTTGYGWVGEGEDRTLVPIPSHQKLVLHEMQESHKLNMRKSTASDTKARAPQSHALHPTLSHALHLSLHSMPSPCCPSQSTKKISDFIPSVTFEDELYARTVRTVHTMAVRQLATSDVYSLLELQNSNGAVISFDHACTTGGIVAGGISAWLEAGSRTFMRQMRDRVNNPINKALFPRGVPCGFSGDGSTDRSLAEQEAVVLRFLGPDGRAFNTFFDLAELDLTESHDGRSPDAQCIAACYASSLSQLNSFKGFLFNSDWKDATVGMSFDGAAVMLGTQNGAATKLREQINGYVSVIHAVAHVEQLAMSDAFKEVEFFEEWKEMLQEVRHIVLGLGLGSS